MRSPISLKVKQSLPHFTCVQGQGVDLMLNIKAFASIHKSLQIRGHKYTVIVTGRKRSCCQYGVTITSLLPAQRRKPLEFCPNYIRIAAVETSTLEVLVMGLSAAGTGAKQTLVESLLGPTFSKIPSTSGNKDTREESSGMSSCGQGSKETQNCETTVA